MNYKQMILSDEELRFLSEDTPYPEGGILSEFTEEGRIVVNAVTAAKPEWLDERVWQLLLLRGFYFLGVLRGAEAYRMSVLEKDDPDCPVPEPLPFTLEEGCVQLFADDLNGLPSTELEQLYTSLLGQGAEASSGG